MAIWNGAVIELSIAIGTTSFRLKLGTSAGKSLSCSGIIDAIQAVGGEATNMPPSTGTGARLGDTAAPGSPGPKAAGDGADAGQSPNPTPVLAQTIAGAMILTAKE